MQRLVEKYENGDRVKMKTCRGGCAGARENTVGQGMPPGSIWRRKAGDFSVGVEKELHSVGRSSPLDGNACHGKQRMQRWVLTPGVFTNLHGRKKQSAWRKD